MLSAIAEKEGIDAGDEEIDTEIRDELERYSDEPRLAEYLGSRRGRSYLRMTLRNRKLVDELISRATEQATEQATGEPATESATTNESE